jgi:hypothetical protein
MNRKDKNLKRARLSEGKVYATAVDPKRNRRKRKTKKGKIILFRDF